jgi:hypothetical protein
MRQTKQNVKTYKDYGQPHFRPEFPASKFFVHYGKSGMMAFCPDPTKKNKRPQTVWPESSWKGARLSIVAAMAAAEWEMMFKLYAILRDEHAKGQRDLWMEIYKDTTSIV